jgi:hypothetical protein
MAKQSIYTEEERRQRQLEAKRRYAEKKRQEKEALATQGPVEVAVDYKTMYEDAMKALTSEQNKNTELEKLCKSFAEQAQQAKANLQKATLEYNARVKYMLECTKHAYISMQFAVDAAEKTSGGNN